MSGMAATDDGKPAAKGPAQPPAKPLSPAAQRALAEAEARRAEIDRKTSERPKEAGGPEGPEPTRHGDWAKKGIASDF